MDISPAHVAPNMSAALASQLEKPIGVSDITEGQKKKLQELELRTIGAVLSAREEKLQET